MNKINEKLDSNLLIYCIEVVLSRRRMIIIITTIFFFLSIIISLAMPRIYRATTKILPPQQDTGLMGALMGSMGGMGALAGDFLGKGSPADMYVSILGSEAVSDAIIDHFKLMEVYDTKYRTDTYKILDKQVDISAGKKDGIISISVEDEDPKRAADMANAYVDEFSKLTVKLNISGAGKNRLFYEERLAKAKTDLSQAEDKLKIFQSKNKALDIIEQAKVTIAGVAQLQAQLAMQEVQLQTLRNQFTDSSQEVKNLKVAIVNLKSQIARLEGNSGGSSIPSVGSVPALGQEYLRLMREFKVQEAVVELLTKQYEMAKLSELKDVSTVQVIQKARVPDKKIKPKRFILIAIVTAFSFFLAVPLAFLLDFIDKLTEERKALWINLYKSSNTGKTY